MITRTARVLLPSRSHLSCDHHLVAWRLVSVGVLLAAMSDLLPVHRFTASAKSQSVEYQVIQLDQSFFLWVSLTLTCQCYRNMVVYVCPNLKLSFLNKWQASFEGSIRQLPISWKYILSISPYISTLLAHKIMVHPRLYIDSMCVIDKKMYMYI